MKKKPNMQNIAVTFQFIELTHKKLDKLNTISDNFIFLYNSVAPRFAGLHSVSQFATRKMMGIWRKELRPRTVVHSKIAEEAIEYARSNYLTIKSSSENTNPFLKTRLFRIHNAHWSFVKYKDRVYVKIPGIKVGNTYPPLILPIKSSDYYDQIISSHTKFGVGQVNVERGTFTTTIEIPALETVKLDYVPETFIGIDMGKNNLATFVAINKDGFVCSQFWNGAENRHIRKGFDRYRADVGRIGREDLTEDADKYEHAWMKNVNHNISRQIVDLAIQLPNPIIVMEELHKFSNYKWNFFQLRQMIGYKARLAGVKNTVVDPKYTSQTCIKCSHIDPNNRVKGTVVFVCVKCNYRNNADFVGAWNIANKIRKEVVG